MRVGIVAQRGNARAAAVAADVRERLHEAGEEVWVDAATAEALDLEGTPVAEFEACDLVVSIGGDGTFLFVARNADTTPVLGVNLGEVGFLNAVAPGDAVEAVEREVERFRETGAVRSRPLERLRVTGEGEWTLPPALNEVTIQGPQRGRGRGVSVEVRVDGSLYAATHADGVVVATPTGSTAYNMSEGGPLVHPDVAGFVVTVMCPTEATVPLLVDTGSEVTVRVDDAARAVVSSDGASKRDVDPPTRLTVERAGEPARVAGRGLEFFQALSKLE